MNPDTTNNEVAPTKTTMTPEEINRRIAIACGVIPHEGYFCHHCGYSVAGKYVTFDERHDERTGGCGGNLGTWTPPNYHSDLNAMHEAEKWMHKNKSLKTFWDYAEELGKITPSLLGTDSVIHATAAQRAESFLRTIGQWEDGK
jgi:hypothetical protein